jgi:hypothetical protein
LKLYVDTIWENLYGRPIHWLIPPDACGANPLLAWTQADHPELIFLANTSLERHSGGFGVPFWEPDVKLWGEFSTAGDIPAEDEKLVFNGIFFPVANLAPAEGRVYRVIKDA